MAGYSKTPLIQKLGIKPGFKICFLSPPSDYAKSLGPLPIGVEELTHPKLPMDFIQGFFKGKKIYEKSLFGFAGPRSLPKFPRISPNPASGISA